MSDELFYLGHRAALGKMSRRDFLGRAAALGVTASFANSILADAARAAGPVKGGMIKAGLVGGESTNSLDPATFASQVPYSFGRNWGELLVELSSKGGLEPRIAEEYSASADAKTWTFKIRKGVEFHNGKTVTPDDVVATLTRHSDENSKSGALGIVKGIDTMKADGDTVVITLKEANADLPYLMADYHLIIQPGGGKDKPDAGISAGPYKVTVNEPGVRHGGERHANYWNAANMGFADQIEIVVINDATARTAALQSGQVHMINRVEPKIVELIKKVPGVEIRNVSGAGHYVFIMHANTAPFDNNDLRMALKYAMNRQEMVDKILLGYGSVGNDFPINAAYPLFPEGIEQRAYDPDKAKFHFQKSGHSGPVLLRTSEVAFRAPSMPRSSIRKAAPRRASPSKSSASPATATGRKCGTSSPSQHRTGAGVPCRTRCIRRPICRPQTGTTRASCARTSTRSSSPPAPSSTKPSARTSIVRRP